MLANQLVALRVMKIWSSTISWLTIDKNAGAEVIRRSKPSTTLPVIGNIRKKIKRVIALTIKTSGGAIAAIVLIELTWITKNENT